MKRLITVLVFIATSVVLFSSAGQAAPLLQSEYDCSSQSQIPQTECEALVTLYNSTDGPNWKNNTNWLTTDTPCDWYGVTCNGGTVTRLALASNQLSGTIPDFTLPNLTYLNLSANQLSGTIPDFTNMPNLTTLYLNSNQLSGTIPDFTNMPNLTALYLHSNQLSGTIPDFTNMPNLTRLDLNSNQLSGTIPDFTNMPNLTRLDLNSNQLSGTIPDFTNMPNLTYLNLGRNQLSGTIPDFTNMPNLTALNLGRNQLSGTIPDFTNLPNLMYLFLDSNQLGGTIPDFTNMPNLTGLRLDSNQLSGTIPDFTNMPNLTGLNLGYNQLSGTIPDFTNMPNLIELSLASNQLSGTIPDFTNMPNLTALYLHNNQLSQIETGFSNLTGLTTLDIGYNHLTNVTDPTLIAFLDSKDPDWADTQTPFPICTSQTQIPQTECEALVTLYNSTDGPKWTNNTNWLTTDTPCGWYGVTCNGGTVTRLSLASNQLSGTIPDFTNMPNLTSLYLHNNQLSGTIPDFTNMPNLTSLYLHNNQLSQIETGFSNLIGLTALDIGYNHLTNVTDPTLIAFLDSKDPDWADTQTPLSICTSQTQIPQTECEALVTLYNSTDGPNWTNNTNWLTTDTPCGWYGVTCNGGTVTRLSLASNQLSGTIPDFTNMPNLTYLSLGSNQLSGTIPDFTNMPNLTTLYLYKNELSGTIPDFTNMPNLTTLYLYKNELSGTIPDFTNMPNLTILYLGSNQLSGTIPDFTNMPNLTTLNLDPNQLSGTIPDFTNLPNLTTLYLRRNQLSGTIPDFTNMPNLTSLYLSYNQLSGTIPDFTNMPNLTTLSLGANQLSGTIPDFTNMPNLRSLSLSQSDQLSGTIPDFTNMPNLTSLNLSANQLSGPIPDFTNLPNLRFLHLSGNQLSGTIPDFTNMPNLTWLYLWRNQLSGTIPDFTNMPNLRDLRLAENQLTGELPPDLINLTKLVKFYFNDTNLCEPTDQAFQDWLAGISDVQGTGVSCTDVIPTLSLTKTTSSDTAQPGDTIDITLQLTTDITTTIKLTDTIPLGLSYVNGSASNGATVTDGQLQYQGQLTPDGLTVSYQVTVDSNLAPGSILYGMATASNGQVMVEAAASIVIPDTEFRETLVLIYASCDNNLTDECIKLMNNAEKGAHNQHVKTLILLDIKGYDNSYLYLLQPDDDPYCPNPINTSCGRYILGQTMWQWGEDLGSRYSLIEFLRAYPKAYPNAENVDEVILMLVGHGDGLTYNLLPVQRPHGGQPSYIPLRPHGGQPTYTDQRPHGGQPGNFLPDETPGSSLALEDVQEALRVFKQETGHTIGLLYLDACLMAMWEVANEVQGYAQYMLASESWTFAAFPYDAYLQEVNGQQTPLQIGQAWLEHQHVALQGYPHTVSLVDLNRMSELNAAVNDMAEQLKDASGWDGGRQKIQDARLATDCFDSNRDGLIDEHDNYCDLASLAHQLQNEFSGNADKVAMFQAVIDAVAQAVIAEKHENGTPPEVSTTQWQWSDDLGGLTIFAPFIHDDIRRNYYTADYFRFAEDSQWDEMLNIYWDVEPPQDCPDGSCDSDTTEPLPFGNIELQLLPGQTQNNLQWSFDQALDGQLELYRWQADNLAPVKIATPIATPYIDSDSTLVKGTEYCYQLKVINDGQEVGFSNIACAKFGQFLIWIPDGYIAQTGDTVLVPVNFGNAGGVCINSLDLRISYDASIAMPTGVVHTTSHTNGFQFIVNSDVAGQIKISAASEPCQELYGSGGLALIEFEVIGDVGQVTPLEFIEGLIDTVIYAEDNLDSPLDLNLDHGSLEITADGACGPADLNCDGVVNGADAAYILRIAVQMVTPTEGQLTSCDVTGDGRCNAADATLTLCYAVHQDWASCGSAIQARSSRQVDTDEPVNLCVGQISGNVGDTVTVPVGISNGIDMAGADITLAYPADSLTVNSISKSSLTDTFNLASNLTEPGLIRVSMANMTPIDNDGTMFEIDLTLNDETTLSFSEIYLNDSAGRDFTSNLQRTVETGVCAKAYTVYMPIVVK